MKKNVMVLVEKKYGNRVILFPEETEIELNDIHVLSNDLKNIAVDGQLMRLTNKSFKEVKKELIKSKAYERLMVL